MNELHLFSGAGGGILGGVLCGHTTVCAVEIELYCRKVLLQRQRDGILPWFPIWDDVCTFDGKPWRGIADIVCGGFPCQDISVSGTREGLNGKRSGLWSEMFRIIGEVRPAFVFVENSPALLIRGIERVLGDLASLGFDSEWGIISATSVGAPHIRERIWILAYSMQDKRTRWLFSAINGTKRAWGNTTEWGKNWNGFEMGQAYNPVSLSEQNHKPDPTRMVNGLDNWLDRIAAVGNGQVPAVVEKAWHVLCQRAAARHCGNGQYSV
jgi:DNA (cytosine-5)-methyltransferase 1